MRLSCKLLLASGVFILIVALVRTLFFPLLGGRWDRYYFGGNFIGVRPSFSPDGSSVIYASPRTGNGDIYIFNLLKGASLRLTTNDYYEGDPSFSPDGKRVVYVRELNDVGHIWIMNADGTCQQQLTHTSNYDHGPAFSPDGRSIVFTRQMRNLKFRPGTAASAELYTMNSDGSEQTRLTDNTKSDWQASYSPDGKKLVFSSGLCELRAMNRSGSMSQLLGSGSSPSFSPDGNRIVYISGKYGGREISIMNSDGSNSCEVYYSDKYKSYPSFSPDGRYILFLESPDSGAAGMIYAFSDTENVLLFITSAD